MDNLHNAMYYFLYMIFLIAGATFLSTILGGVCAFKLKDRLHLILGFSAGAVIAVAFFDILPEALNLASSTYSAETILSLTAGGFMLYLVLDRLFLLRNQTDEHSNKKRGDVGAGSLSFHSFLDGIGIGFAFQVSPAVGILVAAAVLTHDFSDGINTVSLVVKNGGSVARARIWLLADAIAPVLGVIVTLFFAIQEQTLALLLALFAGFFLYIGASNLIPESYHAHPVRWTTYSTVLGVIVIYIAVKLAGG